MASSSYYGNDGGANTKQQIQNANQTYGASYGSEQTYGQQGSYDAGQSGLNSTYSGQQASYDQSNPGGQTYADQQQQYSQAPQDITYGDGSREQKYDAEGNPVLPNGERGLLTNLAGAGAGAYFGHKQGHGIMGALAGGIGAHLLSGALGSNKHRPNHHYGGGGGGGGGMLGSIGGGMLGGLGGSMLGNMMGGGGRRRDIDGNELPDDQQQQQQFGSQDGQAGGYGQVGGSGMQGNTGYGGGSGYDASQGGGSADGYGAGAYGGYQGGPRQDYGNQYDAQQGNGAAYPQDPNQSYGANYGR